MNNEKHVVTISGTEYLEYQKLKKTQYDKRKENKYNAENCHRAIQEEKAKKEIVVNLQITDSRRNYPNLKYVATVHNIDSISETKMLARKIESFLEPVTRENEKLLSELNNTEYLLRNEKDTAHKLSNRISAFNYKSWFKRLFTFKV